MAPIKDEHHMPHIGHLILAELRSQDRSVAWFARQLCCQRSNIYNIFERSNIDLLLLIRISRILNHNFLDDINSCMLPSEV